MSLARERAGRVLVGAMAAWLLLAAAVGWSVAQVPAALRTDARGFGAEWPAAVARALGLGAAELLVLGAFVLWHAADAGARLWLRVLVAGLLLLPYAGFTLLASVHGGPVGAAHAGWRVALALLLVVVAPLLRLVPSLHGRAGPR